MDELRCLENGDEIRYLNTIPILCQALLRPDSGSKYNGISSAAYASSHMSVRGQATSASGLRRPTQDRPFPGNVESRWWIVNV